MKLSDIKVVRPYEAIVIMHPDASTEDQKTLFKKNQKIIQDHNGKVNHIDGWGKRTLATPINGETKAHYFHSTFMAAPETIKELERTMRINEKVLRFFHKVLDPRIDLQKHVDDFKTSLAANLQKAKEREAKARERRAAMAAARTEQF